MAETTRPPIVTILGHVDHGKCVVGDTLIPLSSGRILKAREVFESYSQGLISERVSGGERFKLKKLLKVFSFDGDGIVVRQVSHLWKLKSPKKLVKITLYSGDVVTVTPEHPFYVFTSNGSIVQKRADKVKTEDFVIVPKNLNCKLESSDSLKEEILQRLVKGGNWVVFLDSLESKKFWQKIKILQVSDLIKHELFTSDARTQLRKRRLRIQDYVNLGKFLGFSFRELYEFIGEIKNSSSKWRAGHTSTRMTLPKTKQDFAKLGYILGCIVGDGSIDDGDIYFHNNDEEIYSTFRNYLEVTFNITTKTQIGHTALITRNSGGKTLKRFISEVFQVPQNNKSASVQIPDFIQRDKSMLKEFIAGLFDTDGFVSKINYSAEFTSKSETLLKQVGISLLYFGIHSTLYSKKTYTYLRIANKPYLEAFLNTFNLRLVYKKARIQKALSKSSVSRIFDYTPFTSTILSTIKTNNKTIPYWNNYQKTTGLLTRPFLKNLISLGLLDYQNQMKAVLNTEASSVRVRQIETISSKDEYVYDFTIPETHNFVAERIVVHNTTLLDFIRKTSVAAKEHGGITQHIGAYQVEHIGKLITFIDTPGHAAFEKMRSRGAKVADIAILVVAIDDGIMPQTIEAIKHIKEAKVSLIVTVNKIDLPGINTKVQMDKIKKQLSDREINLEEYGGDVPLVPLSAKTGEGVDKLLEIILLVAELHELKGDPSAKPAGVVIEASLDKFKGAIATILVRNGILKKGDQIILSGIKGKIRGMFDFNGKNVDQAGPSMPVEVLGLETVPPVGATLGEELGSKNQQLREAQTLVDKLKQQGTKTLKVIIKADKQGSLEAIQSSLDKFTHIDFVAMGTGDITEDNVKTAASVGAIVLGFNVKVGPQASKLAETEGVLIRTYNIIYELIEEMEEVVEGLLKVGQLEELIGKAEILAEFEHGKNEKIAGCRVLEGSISKGQRIRIVRDSTILGETKIKSMRKVKEEVNKVEKGNECGMLFGPPVDFQVGDIVESFRVI